MDWLMLAGLCLATAGLALSLWQHLRRQQQLEVAAEAAAGGDVRVGADQDAVDW